MGTNIISTKTSNKRAQRRTFLQCKHQQTTLCSKDKNQQRRPQAEFTILYLLPVSPPQKQLSTLRPNYTARALSQDSQVVTPLRYSSVVCELDKIITDSVC